MASTVDLMRAQAAADQGLARLYSQFLLHNGSVDGIKLSETVPGASLVVQVLSNRSSPGERATVSVDGTSVAISVPLSLLSQFGGAVAVAVAAFTDPVASQPLAGKSKSVEVKGLVQIDLSPASAPGSVQQVSGLADPVLITLGSKAEPDMTCGFYNQEKRAWSSEGVRIATMGPPGAPLVCATTHLSLFGGFINTFRCSQASLLTREGVYKVIESDWYQHPPGQLLLAVIGTSILFLVAAAFLDRRWAKQGLQGDELFLVYHLHRLVDV
jgi:hypothetical protein